MSQVAAKLCTRCGLDVTGASRIKTAHGHYYCPPCWEALNAAPVLSDVSTGLLVIPGTSRPAESVHARVTPRTLPLRPLLWTGILVFAAGLASFCYAFNITPEMAPPPVSSDQPRGAFRFPVAARDQAMLLGAVAMLLGFVASLGGALGRPNGSPHRAAPRRLLRTMLPAVIACAAVAILAYPWVIEAQVRNESAGLRTVQPSQKSAQQPDAGEPISLRDAPDPR